VSFPRRWLRVGSGAIFSRRLDCDKSTENSDIVEKSLQLTDKVDKNAFRYIRFGHVTHTLFVQRDVVNVHSSIGSIDLRFLFPLLSTRVTIKEKIEDGKSKSKES
jgi:hypothetical protein